jgi:hypothetical protein
MVLSKALAKSANYDDRHSLGSTLRARRIRPLMDMIDAAYRDHGSVNIIDVGGRDSYWNVVPEEFLAERKVSITIVNLPEDMSRDHGRFRFVRGDACDLAFLTDHSFHIAHANSVVEHVGDWSRMVLFAKEISRLSPRIFVQTPNYWFPLEPHCMTPFFHWLPEPMRVWLVSHFQLGHWPRAASVDEAVRAVESARLLNRRMLQELFKDAQIVTERFLGWPKSFTAVKM